MNRSPYRTYLRQVSKYLICPRPIRKQLLAQAKLEVTTFCAQEEEPTLRHLTRTFGPPIDFANTLMDEFSTSQRLHFVRQKNRQLLAIALLLLLLIGGTAICIVHFYHLNSGYQVITGAEEQH